MASWGFQSMYPPPADAPLRLHQLFATYQRKEAQVESARSSLDELQWRRARYSSPWDTPEVIDWHERRYREAEHELNQARNFYLYWRSDFERRAYLQQRQHRAPPYGTYGGGHHGNAYYNQENYSEPNEPPPQTSPTNQTPTPLLSQDIINRWRQSVESAFANYAAIQTFPSPPFLRCINVACQATAATRANAGCACNIRYAFEQVVGLDLKQERVRWHPDKFSTCMEEKREEFEKMAKEVFVVVDEMYQEAK